MFLSFHVTLKCCSGRLHVPGYRHHAVQPGDGGPLPTLVQPAHSGGDAGRHQPTIRPRRFAALQHTVQPLLRGLRKAEHDHPGCGWVVPIKYWRAQQLAAQPQFGAAQWQIYLSHFWTKGERRRLDECVCVWLGGGGGALKYCENASMKVTLHAQF